MACPPGRPASRTPRTRRRSSSDTDVLVVEDLIITGKPLRIDSPADRPDDRPVAVDPPVLGRIDLTPYIYTLF